MLWLGARPTPSPPRATPSCASAPRRSSLSSPAASGRAAAPAPSYGAIRRCSAATRSPLPGRTRGPPAPPSRGCYSGGDVGDLDTAGVPLDGAGLTNRTLNFLRRARLHTAGDAPRAPREELLRLRGIGPASLSELDAGPAGLGRRRGGAGSHRRGAPVEARARGPGAPAGAGEARGASAIRRVEGRGASRAEDIARSDSLRYVSARKRRDHSASSAASPTGGSDSQECTHSSQSSRSSVGRMSAALRHPTPPAGGR